jgi:AcrR family transcriptional regulator
LKDTFTLLSAEKRDRVINGVLSAFAKTGYKKTSVMDLADAAGVSKAMIFSYFANKQGAYEYMCRYAVDTAWDEFRQNAHKILTDDFFERIRLSVEIKVALMKRNPDLLRFFTSMYYEQDEAVRPAIENLLGESFTLREDVMLKGVDNNRFKDGIDAKIVAEMLTWMSGGLADAWHRGENDIDNLLQRFLLCLATLKNNLYKEEFLV